MPISIGCHDRVYLVNILICVLLSTENTHYNTVFRYTYACNGCDSEVVFPGGLYVCSEINCDIRTHAIWRLCHSHVTFNATELHIM